VTSSSTIDHVHVHVAAMTITDGTMPLHFVPPVSIALVAALGGWSLKLIKCKPCISLIKVVQRNAIVSIIMTVRYRYRYKHRYKVIIYTDQYCPYRHTVVEFGMFMAVTDCV